ncbi:MAG: type IV pilus twitching motility protein PilT [Thermoanaerobaculia bacterium]
MKDPELSKLVQELNQDDPADAARDSASRLAHESPLAPESEQLSMLLLDSIERGASDLLLISGAPPAFRVNGELRRGAGEVLDDDDLRRLFARYLRGHAQQKIEIDGAADFTVTLSVNGKSHRFRANLHRQRGHLAAAVRRLETDIPTLAQLNLPARLADLAKPQRGLVLVCGPTGSGKSSTLAALVGEINRTTSRHIVTIEDPVEYEHRNDRSVIEHIEIGRDASSFAGALRAALRQDPDVIVIGEMRDHETASTALSAAETGHLIFATLHTNDAAQSIHRIVDLYPSGQQTQVYRQIALALTAILCQQLVPTADGKGRVPALEFLNVTYAARNLIRNEKLENLYNEVAMGKRNGSITYEDSLADLTRRGIVTMEEALLRTSHPDELRKMVL